MKYAHCGDIVGDYMKYQKYEGYLVVIFIEGGLTLILQFCIPNVKNQLKYLIKD